MSTLTPAVLAQQCPLCGEGNQCAQAKAQATGQPPEACWCFSQAIPAAVLAQVPAARRGLQCVCLRCAQQQTAPADAA